MALTYGLGVHNFRVRSLMVAKDQRGSEVVPQIHAVLEGV